MYHHHVYANLKSVHLKYGKKMTTPSKQYIGVYSHASDHGSYLKQALVVTPTLIVPWKKTYSNDEKSFNIEFCNHESKFMDELETFAHHVITKSTLNMKKYSIHIDQIKTYPNRAKALRFFNVKIRDVSVYNEYGECIDVHDIDKDDTVKALLHIHALVVKDNKVTLEIRLAQMMRVQPYTLLHANACLVDEGVAWKSTRVMTIPTRSIQMPPPPPPPPLLLEGPKKPTIPPRPVCFVSIDDLVSAKAKLRRKNA